MTKVKFDKEETKNLLSMLSSDDAENHAIAFQALENADLDGYIGELLVLYKYSKLGQDIWAKESPKAWNIILKNIGDVDKNKPISLTSGKCMSIITDTKSSKESIELYLEYFVKDMIGFLTQMGFQTDKFIVDIKLKD